MPCGWEGNHRSGVALSTRQTLVVLHLRAQGLEEGDEHPPMLSCGEWLTLPYLTLLKQGTFSVVKLCYIGPAQQEMCCCL